MTTSGTKGQHFNCQMKMKAEVACAHDVKITATAGLTIDKAGVVGAELGYNYPAGQGLIAQDVGILPTSCGSGKLFAAITSPYFVTPSGLKIKRDVINIQVECEESDGWSGDKPGAVYHNSGLAQAFAPGSLKYIYTATSVGGTLTIYKTKIGAHSLRTQVVDPQGAITHNPSISIAKLGKYIIEVAEGFRVADTVSSNDVALGVTSWTAAVVGNPTKNPTDVVSRDSTGLDRVFYTYVRVPIGGPWPHPIDGPMGATTQLNAPGPVVLTPPIHNSTAPGVTVTYSGQNAEARYSGMLPAWSYNPGALSAPTAAIGEVIVCATLGAQANIQIT